MTPSRWTVYVMMVHDVTGESARTILYHMALARGLQYQVAWWRFRYAPMRGVTCEPLALKELGGAERV